MGFQRGMLDPLGRKRSLVGDRGLGKCAGDIAVFAVALRHDIALRVGHPLLSRLVAVDQGRAGCNRLRRIGHRGQDVVIDCEAAAAFFRRCFSLRDHGGDPLSDEADDIVQHAGIVGVHPGPLVPRGGEQAIRRVLEGQHRLHASNVQRRGLVDRDNLCVRMRRAQQLDVQRAFHGCIEGVGSRAPHHLRSGGCRQAAAECGARDGVFAIRLAVQRVFDGTIAGAAAQIAFQRCAEILPLRLVERCTGHDHARGAEPALKRLRIEKCPLHRMGTAIAREAFDGGDGMALGAKGGDQAAVHRLAIDQHGTGAAVAGVAPFLDAEMPELAQKSSQALSGAGIFRKRLAVDLEAHGCARPCSSARISSARRMVMCLRHAGLP